ncbi:MAG TPA: hypothetical protein PLL30_05370 [Candidatus Krumholzibacteria bacterium]|nr:hypothetical protein [Candidatus Krumholzibacteria bacterium]HPD71191.1 hypothetical protein [Candidatus Krumholzibacteria bacterium]HRY39109.1 hypothetical protein [Candidatus Krumholzibacteria bacterium]
MVRTPGLRSLVRLAAPICLGVIAGLVSVTAVAGPSQAESPPRDARRDSLRAEIQRYSGIIQALRDSVSTFDRTDGARRQQLAELEASISSLTEAIGEVTAQFSEMELEIDAGRVSLRDGRGGQVVVDLPPDFSDRLSEGISSISKVILEEMPDTVRIGDDESGFTWSLGEKGLNIVPIAPRPQRTIEGGIVKFRDDLEVGSDEIVLGDVVVVMGDALIEGRIEGDLVVVLGDLQLGETAEVDGNVVAVLGGFDRSDAAKIGSVTVVNPTSSFLPRGLGGDRGDWLGFWAWQGLFLGLVVCVLLLLVLAPRRRLEATVQTLATRPRESLGVGLVGVLVGHAVVLGLCAILVLTVIGIPVALLVVLAVVLLDLAAIGIASMVVGRRVCALLHLGCDNPWRKAALGMVAIHLPAFLAALLGTAGAPAVLVLMFVWASRLLKLTAFCFGVGALLLGRFGTSRARSSAPAVLTPLESSRS